MSGNFLVSPLLEASFQAPHLSFQAGLCAVKVFHVAVLLGWPFTTISVILVILPTSLCALPSPHLVHFSSVVYFIV